jgi:hypothetical protein
MMRPSAASLRKRAPMRLLAPIRSPAGPLHTGAAPRQDCSSHRRPHAGESAPSQEYASTKTRTHGLAGSAADIRVIRMRRDCSWDVLRTFAPLSVDGSNHDLRAI